MFIVHEGCGWSVLTYEAYDGVYHTMHCLDGEWHGPIVTSNREAATALHMRVLAQHGEGSYTCHATNG